MSFEKMAIFGIIAFAFMAAYQGLRTIHETKKLAGRKRNRRPRRLISSEPIAKDIAESLLKDVVKNYPDLAKEAMETGVIPKELNREIKQVQEHYLSRVSYKFKGLFYLQTSIIILGKQDSNQ